MEEKIASQAHMHIHSESGNHQHQNDDAHEHSHDGSHHHSHDGAHDPSHVAQPHSHDGEHQHSHEGTGTLHHGHTHSHQNTKMVLNRLSRASGHLDAVKRMVEDGKDCSEVLVQLSAVIAALHNTGKVILSDHISNCIVDAVESGDKSAIDNLNAAINRFIK